MTDARSESPQQPDVAADAVAERAASLVTEVTEAPEGTDAPRRLRRLTGAVAEATRSGARSSGRGVRAARRGMGRGTGWLAGQVVAMAPRLRVRDQAALRAQFPGMPAEDIADALIEGAGRASAAVGGAVGAWAVLPVLPAWPAEVAAETLAVVGIEIKLVAELHEAYGVPAGGGTVERMTAYVGAWAHRRGVFLAPGGVVVAAGSPVARLLRRRLAARAARSAFSLGPLLSGAAAGALLNRHETRRLGQEIRTDLRRRTEQGRGIEQGRRTEQGRGTEQGSGGEPGGRAG
jgi:hypothetical protein